MNNIYTQEENDELFKNSNLKFRFNKIYNKIHSKRKINLLISPKKIIKVIKSLIENKI